MQWTPPRNAFAHLFPCTLATVVLLLAVACGSEGDPDRVAPDDQGTASGTASELPAPEGAIGSVTGMPANPGTGTPQIALVDRASGDPSAPAQAAGAQDTYDETYIGTGGIEGLDIQSSIPEAPANGERDAVANAPPIFIVPEVPIEPVATGVAIGDGDAPASPRPTRQPTGTEAATESTTLVIEPADTGD